MAKDSKEKTQEPTKKVSGEMSQDQRSRINSLWNKLQQSENTKFITEGGKADLSPAAQENIMRQNINKYADANLNNNINSVGMGCGRRVGIHERRSDDAACVLVSIEGSRIG